MGSFVSYIIVSAIALLTLWIAYRWALADENQHTFNRFVLLSIYGVSTIFPAVAAIRFGSVSHVPSVALGEITATLAEIQPAAPALKWTAVVVAVYFVGVFAMSVMTAATWFRLSRIVARGERRQCGRFTLVLTDDNTLSPFSWLHYVVMSRDDYESDGRVIVAHEMKHLSLLHPADMLLAQAFVIAQWFNPAAWLMRVELRAVHEYQADMAVIESGFNPRQYQLMLVKKAVGKKFPSLANSLNHSKLKKRITMMINSKNSPRRRFRALAMVPAFAVALVAANLPVVSNAMTDLGEVSLPDKVTNNSVTADDDGPETVVDALQTQGTVISIKKSDDTSSNSVKTSTTAKIGEDAVYMVDGKQVESINQIDPNTIKSITVRKDTDKPHIFIELKSPDQTETSTPEKKVLDNEIVVVGYGERSNSDKAGENVIENTVEEMPQFPGGEKELMKFIAQQIRFPQSELGADKPDKAMVVVRFTIAKDGAVSNPEIIRSGGEAFNNEALRIVNMIPNFIPGKINGVPVATFYTLPVIFRKQ